MSKVAIHPPKTPVTEGSNGIAKATLPNVCKMPGPPAPFVPTPLPNVARSGSSPKGYSTSVTIDGHGVALRGATFESTGDMASKGTGGGLSSANTHGPATFIAPGSMTVKIEGKNVHLLGEPMLNNCGPGGNPPNTGATMMGLTQGSLEKPQRCPPHGPEVPEEHDRLQEIEEQKARIQASQKNLEDARKAYADAEQALAAKAGRMSTLRAAVPKAARAVDIEAKRLEKLQEKLNSLMWEEKVAKDCGGARNIKLVCETCKADMGDFDVVADDGRVKEVKSSEGGYNKDKFERYRVLVEETNLIKGGKLMKLAVPGGVYPALNNKEKYPELQDRLQGH
jgi:uncharacterized Zn-binding protein involved in type VI secretion